MNSSAEEVASPLAVVSTTELRTRFEFSSNLDDLPNLPTFNAPRATLRFDSCQGAHVDARKRLIISQVTLRYSCPVSTALVPNLATESKIWPLKHQNSDAETQVDCVRSIPSRTEESSDTRHLKFGRRRSHTFKKLRLASHGAPRVTRLQSPHV